MRYIGNKTKLLEFIGTVLDEKSITSGTAFDAFSGTASVGRYLKRRGFDVFACDLMTYSYVFQKALIETDRIPRFEELRQHDAGFRAVRDTPEFRVYVDSRFGFQTELFGNSDSDYNAFNEVACYLDQFIPNVAGLITRHYAADAEDVRDGRMFFTLKNAQRIDAIRLQIDEWRRSGLLDDSGYYALLTSLLDAADSVANTTGVYAAFVKTWQANAQRPLQLGIPALVVNTGRHCKALQGNVNDVIAQVPELDLLYLDPPYNTRQYSSYYHIPELLARGWHDWAPNMRGKTGLIDDADKKSVWSTSGGCVSALEDLLARARARRLLMSYNSEGIIPEADIQRLFKEYGHAQTFQVFEREYDRYRSDSDSEQRQYKADTVIERIYYVERSSR